MGQTAEEPVWTKPPTHQPTVGQDNIIILSLLHLISFDGEFAQILRTIYASFYIFYDCSNNASLPDAGGELKQLQ